MELIQLAGRLGEARLVELHLLDRDLVAVDLLDGLEPAHHHALLLGLSNLELVSGHAVAITAVDDHRVGGAEALGGAGRVHRGVAAAVDDDLAAEQRLLVGLHRLEHRDGVEDARGLAGRDVGVLADVGADREERRVEAAFGHRLFDVGDLPVQLELDANRQDSVDLGIEHVAREPVGRDPEAHHAAGHRPGLEDRHLVAEAAQVVRGREAGGAGTDDQNALAGGLGGRVEGPALLDRLVAYEALDRVDADGLIELPPVAGGLAGVVTDATHDRRERVVLDDLVPGTLVPLAAVLGLVQPGLAVLAGGAGVVTGGQPVDVLGALGPPAAGLVGEAGADVERDGEGQVLFGGFHH